MNKIWPFIMLCRRFAIALWWCLPIASLAQGVPQQAPSPAWIEHYRNSTISIGRATVPAQGQPSMFQVLGTAIIVAADEHTSFIVTAKHVFDDPAQNWHPSELLARFAWQEKKSLAEAQGLPIQLTTPSGANLWTASLDSDLAILPLPSNFAALPLQGISYQDFASSNDDLFDGATVFVYGYPEGTTTLVGNQAIDRAITRSGVVAWSDPINPLANPFLIDANISPGNSGGPVLKAPSGLTRSGTFAAGGRVAFLGIVTQDLNRWYAVRADGRIIQVKFPDLIRPSVEQVVVTGVGGLGKVEPASKVRSLIESAVHPSAAK